MSPVHTKQNHAYATTTTAAPAAPRAAAAASGTQGRASNGYGTSGPSHNASHHGAKKAYAEDGFDSFGDNDDDDGSFGVGSGGNPRRAAPYSDDHGQSSNGGSSNGSSSRSSGSSGNRASAGGSAAAAAQEAAFRVCGVRVGQRVSVTGVMAKPELNGRTGVASAFDATNQRFLIELDPIPNNTGKSKSNGSSGAELVKLKPDNVQLSDTPPPPPPAAPPPADLFSFDAAPSDNSSSSSSSNGSNRFAAGAAPPAPPGASVAPGSAPAAAPGASSVPSSSDMSTAAVAARNRARYQSAAASREWDPVEERWRAKEPPSSRGDSNAANTSFSSSTNQASSSGGAGGSGGSYSFGSAPTSSDPVVAAAQAERIRAMKESQVRHAGTHVSILR